MTCTVPTACSISAMCASTVGRLVDADLLVGVRLNVARSWAVPNPALAGGGVLTATAEPTTTAATATMIRSRIRNCWRHSRLKRRQDQRSMARRAGTPPLVGSGADSVAGRSRTPTLTVREVGEERFRALDRERLVDDSAVAQEDHAVGPRGELGVVGHHDGGQAAVAGREDQAHDGLGVGGVERAGGLVGQEQLAVAHDGAGDGDPLALATRQLVGVVRRPVGQPEVLERLERRRLGLAGRDAVELEGQGHVLHRAEPGQQVVVLEDVADGLAAQARLAVAGQRRQRRAADVDLTARGVLEAAGDGQQRALARAAGAHDGHQRPGVDGEIDASGGRAPRRRPRRRPWRCRVVRGSSWS